MEQTNDRFTMDKLNKFMSNIRNTPLPGMEAHIELTPYRSLPSSYDLQAARKGAVAVIVQNNIQPSIILTKRAGYEGVHGGQISFPGGKFELDDVSLLKTAIRETEEEIGFDLLEQEMYCTMTDLYIPPSNFNVSPFLFLTEREPTYKLSNEVDYIIHLGVEEFMQEELIYRSIKLHNGMTIKEAPCFLYKGEIIWGATAAILNELRWLLRMI